MTTASFCHSGTAKMASYRYRCATPAAQLGAGINNPNADVLIFSKPVMEDVHYAVKAHRRGARVIVDICDWHFDQQHYRMLVKMADVVTCSSTWMADFLRMDYGIEAIAIPDPHEFPDLAPHCAGGKCLWFGNATNYASLNSVLPYLDSVDLRRVSNVEGDIPWSHAAMLEELCRADIVIMPETAPYKSANRTIEAIRQGCFVCAEPHPALEEFEGLIWIGSIRKGIEWAQQNPRLANEMTMKAQAYVRSRFGPQTLASAWKSAIQKALACISAAEISAGTDGSELMLVEMLPT